MANFVFQTLNLYLNEIKILFYYNKKNDDDFVFQKVDYDFSE